MKKTVSIFLVLTILILSIVQSSFAELIPTSTPIPRELETEIPTELPYDYQTEVPTDTPEPSEATNSIETLPQESIDARNYKETSLYVDGIRLGFFNNSNIPLDIEFLNGAVYVPLFPLLESLGIDYSITNKRIDISTAASKKMGDAKTNKIEITTDNFKDYFEVSTSVINEKLSKGIVVYTAYGDVSLTIEAKAPFEIHDVAFTIDVHTNTDFDVRFSGIMPQNASFSSTSKTISRDGISENTAKIMAWNYKVVEASGYIVTNN